MPVARGAVPELSVTRPAPSHFARKERRSHCLSKKRALPTARFAQDWRAPIETILVFLGGPTGVCVSRRRRGRCDARAHRSAGKQAFGIPLVLRMVETSVEARTMESVLESHRPCSSALELSFVRIGLETAKIRVEARCDAGAHRSAGQQAFAREITRSASREA